MRLAAERAGLLASTGRFQWGIGPARGDMRHERHRFTTQPRNRCRRKCTTPALADLHRSLRLRRGAAMAIWPDPSHGGLRPHLHLLGHWCTLYWRLAALPMAHDRDRPRSRCITRRRARLRQARSISPLTALMPYQTVLLPTT